MEPSSVPRRALMVWWVIVIALHRFFYIIVRGNGIHSDIDLCVFFFPPVPKGGRLAPMDLECDQESDDRRRHLNAIGLWFPFNLCHWDVNKNELSLHQWLIIHRLSLPLILFGFFLLSIYSAWIGAWERNVLISHHLSCHTICSQSNSKLLMIRLFYLFQALNHAPLVQICIYNL